MSKRLLLSACLLVGSTVLTACVPLIVGGAALTASVATDRRTSAAQLADKEIYLRANSRLSNQEIGDLSYLAKLSYNQTLYLIGQVPSTQIKQRVLNIAKDIPNVVRVVERITVEPPLAASVRANDRWLSSKVQSELLITKGVPYNSINILTVDGTVYLFGLVTEQEATQTANVAAHVKGVKQVTQAFEYVLPDDLKTGNINNSTDPKINSEPSK